MVWIILIGILLFLGLKFPKFGNFIFIGGGITILLIVLTTVWSIYNSNQKQEVAKSLIPLNQIELSNLSLNKDFSSYQLSGEVKNNSAYTLEDITLAVRAYDCLTNVINSDCTIVGEDDNVSTYIEIPPGQVRSLNNVTFVNLDNMPPIHGNFLWSYQLLSTIAKQP